MILKNCTTFLFLILFPYTFLCPGRNPKKDVDRIVKTLSSDALEGRKIFTDGIEKAADFIQNEFYEIGLKTFQGLDNYEQDFLV